MGRTKQLRIKQSKANALKWGLIWKEKARASKHFPATVQTIRNIGHSKKKYGYGAQAAFAKRVMGAKRVHFKKKK